MTTPLIIDPNPNLPVYRRVVDAVEAAIRAGQLEPRQKLPAQSALAKSLGVNATTVRYAYDMLEKQGLVEAKHGSGTYVLPGAKEKLKAGPGRKYSVIYVVIGARQLVDRSREDVFLTSDILRGVELGMGELFPRVEFVESFEHDCLGDISDDSAVLIKKTESSDMSLYEQLCARGIPVLGVWGNAMSFPLPSIHYDLVQAPKLACQHLIDCGYKRIGFIGCKSASDTVPMGMKFFGFTDALHDAGLDYKASHVRDVEQATGRAYRAALDIIETGDLPEAFFVDTDMKAMEVIHALNDAGLRVPDDIGVIGYDGLPETASFDPPLTTVRTPRQDIGQRAAELLLGWTEQTRPRQHESLSAQLVVRQSTIARHAVATRTDSSAEHTDKQD